MKTSELKAALKAAGAIQIKVPAGRALALRAASHSPLDCGNHHERIQAALRLAVDTLRKAGVNIPSSHSEWMPIPGEKVSFGTMNLPQGLPGYSVTYVVFNFGGAK